ncbi:MAG: toll/interleukin-1 receptor domain-containing protein [Erysipelotrichaceae bacterium]|nr:toll/interleukin-1 receptor domain-containing protein [Erysipelotrichaceae bacterium]
MTNRYDVFFSYRHKPLDSEITSKVFQWVESYRLPASLKKQGYQDIQRAFRDAEELPVSRILTDTIDDALRSASVLIVVCSQDTPSSEWVDREVEMFIELGRAEQIYPLLINGDETTSFPPSLKKVPDIRERIMDIRVPGDSIREMMKKVPDELLKAVAGITGCKLSELVREDSFRKNRTIVRRALIAAAVLLFTGSVSYILMNMAQKYRDEALLREKATMSILNELTYELPDRLVNIPGAYARIADILEENTQTIDRIIRLSADSTNAEYESAANREKLANARSVLGVYDEALTAQREAVEAYEILADSGEREYQLAWGSSYNNLGNILHAAGNYTEASVNYRNAIGILEKVQNTDALLLAQVYGNLAGNAVSMGDPSAESYFDQTLALLKGSDDPEYLLASAGVLYNRGIGLYRTGNYPDAAKYLKDSADQYAALLETNSSLQNQRSYLQTMSVLAACLTDAGEYEQAEEYYFYVEETAEQALSDRENMNDLLLMSGLYNNHGLCLNIQGRYAEADSYYRKASEVNRQIYENAQTASAGAAYAQSLLNTGENAFKAGEYRQTEELFEEGLAVFETVYDGLDVYDQAQYYTWRSYHRLINERDPAAAYDDALEACRLQPDSVLANMNLGYACLYCGYEEDCDRILGIIASLGSGQAETIRKDLQAQAAAGLQSDHTEAVLEMIEGL